MTPVEGRIGGKLNDLPARQRKTKGSPLLEWQPFVDLERACNKGLTPNSYEGIVITPELRKKLGKSVARRATIILRNMYKDFPYDVERRSLLNGNEEVLVKYPPERVHGKHTPVVREMPTGSAVRAKAKAKSKRSQTPAQDAQAELPAVSQ